MDREMLERRIENRKKEMQAHFEKAQKCMEENDFCGARTYLQFAEEDATEILAYEAILESMMIWG